MSQAKDMTPPRRRRPLLLLAAAVAFVAGAGCAALDRRGAAPAIPLPGSAAGAVAVAARPFSSGHLSLQKAITMAVQHNRQAQIAQQERYRAAGVRYEALSRVLPKLAFQGSYTHLPTLPSFDVLGQSIPMGQKNNYSATLAFQQTLFASGGNVAALRGSAAFARAAEAAEQAVLQLAASEAERAYDDVLLARQMAHVATEALELAKEHLADVTKRFDQGAASSFDKLRAAVEVSNVDAQAIRARNTLRLAEAKLCSVIGVSQDSRLELTDVLQYKPANVDIAEEQRALSHRPDLVALAEQVQVEKQRRKIARADALPKVELSAVDAWSKPGLSDSLGLAGGLGGSTGGGDWEENQTIALTIQFPIFDGLQTRGKLMEHDAAIRQAELKLMEQAEAALLQVKQAVLSVEDAQKFVESQLANVEQAREALRLAKAGYAAGVNRLIEVRDARVALTVAEQNYYQAVHAHAVAVLALRTATGSIAIPGQPEQRQEGALR